MHGASPRKTDRSAPWSRRAELCVAALLLVLPVGFLLTYHSPRPAFWRYSATALAGVLGFLGGAALVLASYRWRIPRSLDTLRSFVVLVAATLVVGLVLLEYTLRFVEDAPYAKADNSGRHAPDPDVGHVYLPDFEQVIQGREFRQTWRSNGQGVRADRDFGPRAPGVMRILAVGDSFTVGDQVALEDTYPSVLERELEARLGAGRVEVVNAGFPAYGTVHEARWIKKFGGQFEPDLVLLAMTPNDLGENLDPLRLVARHGAMVDRAATEQDFDDWLQRNRWFNVAGWVERSFLLELLLSSPTFRKLRYGNTYTHRHAYMVEPDEESTRRHELARTYLREARDNAAALGARFAILIIPFREQLGPLDEPGLDPALFGRRITEFAREEDIPALDLLPAFRAAAEGPALYWRHDSHCNREGYALIGRQAAAFLLDQGICDQ